VEAADVAAAGDPLPPELLDLELSELVGQRLPRDGRVAVGLVGGVALVAAAGAQGRDRPRTGPSEGVDAGVGDQPRRPQRLQVANSGSTARKRSQ